MLLALVIFGFLFVAVYQLLTIVADADQRSALAFEKSAQETQSWQIIRQDILAAKRRPSSDQYGDRVAAFQLREGRSLIFIRGKVPSFGVEKQSDLQRVEYYLENGEMTRRSWSALDVDPASRSNSITLFKGVKGVDIVVFDEKGRGYRDWPASRTREGFLSMPARIEFSVEMERGDIFSVALPGLGE